LTLLLRTPFTIKPSLRPKLAGVFTPERRVGVQDVEGDGDQCTFGNDEVHVAGGERGGKGNG